MVATNTARKPRPDAQTVRIPLETLKQCADWHRVQFQAAGLCK